MPTPPQLMPDPTTSWHCWPQTSVSAHRGYDTQPATDGSERQPFCCFFVTQMPSLGREPSDAGLGHSRAAQGSIPVRGSE